MLATHEPHVIPVMRTVHFFNLSSSSSAELVRSWDKMFTDREAAFGVCVLESVTVRWALSLILDDDKLWPDTNISVENIPDQYTKQACYCYCSMQSFTECHTSSVGESNDLHNDQWLRQALFYKQHLVSSSTYDHTGIKPTYQVQYICSQLVDREWMRTSEWFCKQKNWHQSPFRMKGTTHQPRSTGKITLISLQVCMCNTIWYHTFTCWWVASLLCCTEPKSEKIRKRTKNN